MQTQITLLLNKEINGLITEIAERMGTSKRNVISIALSDVIKKEITVDDVNVMKERINGLNHPTNITVNEEYKNKIYNINRHGLSIRKFIGYLVCDYFYRNNLEFINDKHKFKESDKEKENTQFILNKEYKKKIVLYCEDHAMTMNSLYTHYILNKELDYNAYNTLNLSFENKSDEKLTNLVFSKSVKETLKRKSEELNINIRYYLKLLSYQIIDDLNL